MLHLQKFLIILLFCSPPSCAQAGNFISETFSSKVVMGSAILAGFCLTAWLTSKMYGDKIEQVEQDKNLLHRAYKNLNSLHEKLKEDYNKTEKELSALEDDVDVLVDLFFITHDKNPNTARTIHVRDFTRLKPSSIKLSGLAYRTLNRPDLERSPEPGMCWNHFKQAGVDIT